MSGVNYAVYCESDHREFKNVIHSTYFYFRYLTNYIGDKTEENYRGNVDKLVEINLQLAVVV